MVLLVAGLFVPRLLFDVTRLAISVKRFFTTRYFSRLHLVTPRVGTVARRLPLL